MELEKYTVSGFSQNVGQEDGQKMGDEEQCLLAGEVEKKQGARKKLFRNLTGAGETTKERGWSKL